MSKLRTRKLMVDGQLYDVVYYEKQASHGVPEIVHLESCIYCSQKLVYPVSWAQTSNGCWIVNMRCPDCHKTWVGNYDQADVERFDKVLNMGIDSIMDTLEELAYANMEHDVEAFTKALINDHLLPEDF